MSFLSKERIMAQKYSWKMGNFGQRALRHQLSWFQSVTILRLLFLVIEKVWQVWSCSKSWCIPNYQLSVSFKTHHFFCPISEEFENKFLNQEFYGQLPEQAWSNGLFDFSKSCPSGCQVFSNDSKEKESIYQDGLTTNNDHQSFRNPRYSKPWKHFHFLLFYSKKNTILFRDKKKMRNYFFVFFFFRNSKHTFFFWQVRKNFCES